MAQERPSALFAASSLPLTRHTWPTWSNPAWSSLPAEIVGLVLSNESVATSLSAQSTLSIAVRDQIVNILVQPITQHGVLVTLLALSQRSTRQAVFRRRLAQLGAQGQKFLDFDEAHSLGPVDTWSETLQSTTAMMLAFVTPMALYVGADDDPIMLVNDAFMDLGFPNCQGKPATQVFDRVAGPRVCALHQALRDGGDPICYRASSWELIAADGSREERFFDIEWVACHDPDDGHYICGVNKPIEVTDAVLGQRRLEALQTLGQRTALARSVVAYCETATAALADFSADTPFALFYTVLRRRTDRPSLLAGASGHALRLQASFGVPPGHPAALPTLHLRKYQSTDGTSTVDPASGAFSPAPVYRDDDDDVPFPVLQAAQTGLPTLLVEVQVHTAGLAGRSAADAVSRVVVLPIFGDGQTLEGCLIIGLDNKRRYDRAFEGWLGETLRETLATGLAKAMATEQADAHARKVRELEEAKNTFFSSISNELRTPLSLILGPLEDVLSDKGLEHSTRVAVRTANRGALRLMSLVTTVLDFFRLQSGKLTATFRPVHLGTLVGELATLFAGALPRNDVRVVVDVRPGVVYTDPDLMSKVILGILGTLLRNRPWRGGQIKVSVKVEQSAAHVVIMSVDGSAGRDGEAGEDAPAGEADDEEAFASTSFDRLGLGHSVLLALVKTLRAELREDRSPTSHSFRVTLRTLDASHLADEHVVEEEDERPVVAPMSRYSFAMAALEEGSAASDDSASSTPGVPLGRLAQDDPLYDHSAISIHGASVLLADSDADMRKYCHAALAALFNVTEADNTVDVKSIALTDAPDLIIVADDLLGSPSLDVLLSLREAGCQVPIIVLSSRATSEARIDGLMAGADELLAKPFSAKELVVRAASRVQFAKMKADLEKRYIERTAALAESEARARDLSTEFQALFDLSTVGLFRLNEQGAVEKLNTKWYEVTGAPPDMPLNEWPAYVMPEDLQPTIAIFTDAVERQGSCQLTATWTSGKATLISMDAYKIADGSVRFIGSVVDVSELKRLELLQLEASEQRAAEALAMRQALELSVDVTSHELRNPLSGVIQAAELLALHLERIVALADRNLADGRITEAHHAAVMDQLSACEESVETIQLCSKHQRRVADDILNFSKINMQLLTLAYRPCDVIALVENTAKMHKPEYEQYQIAVQLDLGATAETMRTRYVEIDGHRLSQVVLNFVSNAVRYSAEATNRIIVISLRVTDRCPPKSATAMRVLPDGWEPPPPSADQVWVSCGVQDHGRGLSEDERKRLFNRFAQARPAVDSLSGFGLGLFISKSIVHLSGGFIEIESERDAGSTFRFVVPARPADPASVPKPETAAEDRVAGLARRLARLPGRKTVTKKRQREATLPIEAVPGKPQVLVVDDSTINLRLLQRQLEMKGYLVHTGMNGQEALDAIEVHRPQLIAALIDCEMPVMNGPTAMRELRRREATAGLARLLCIAVTGNAREEQKAGCLEAGYDYVATKPYTLDHLVSLIESKTVDSRGDTPML